MSTETSTTPEIPPATRRAAEAIGAEFTARLTVDMKPIGIGEATILGVPLVKIARAALASLDVDELAKLLGRCVNWELSLLSKHGPYIVCTDCRAHVLDDITMDEDFDIHEDELPRIRAAGMRHHAESVRAAILGEVL